MKWGARLNRAEYDLARPFAEDFANPLATAGIPLALGLAMMAKVESTLGKIANRV